MICVSLGRSSVEELLHEHAQLVAAGAELVEYRLDYLPLATDVAQLLAARRGPVIVTCRRPADGGKYAGDEATRRRWIEAAIAAGAEYVDLEADLAATLPRAGQTKRIVSHHDFQGTPADLAALRQRLAALDADIVKMATTATTPHDNVRMLTAVRDAATPTVGFCMGDIGTPSRVLCGRFGSPFTYAASSRETAVAPGQLSFADLRDLYRYDQINAQTEVFGVIADPVGHSLSPLIHNAAFARLKMNRVYLPIRVPPADLSQFFDEAPSLGIRGLSITIPHKENSIPKLGEADPAVYGIGACNTAVYDGRQWRGWNTDCLAAIESIELALGGLRDGQSPIAGRRALLLGAGGAGKALGVGLLNKGAHLTVTDADAARAAQLAERLPAHLLPWEDRYSTPIDVLVNCTPVGMYPKVDATPFDAASLKSDMLVFDAVYNPEYTRLLTEAKAKGCRVVSGVEMFVRQACMQFKLFTGQDGPADLMREKIQQAMAKH